MAASYLTFGDEFEGLSGGFGGELSVRYTWYGGFQLLSGVHYSVHDVERLPADVKFLELFVDPRYIIQLFESQRVVLLIAGRLAYASERAAGGIDATANGFIAAGLVGGLYSLRSTLAVEVTLLFGGFWTDRLQVEPNPPALNGSISSIQLGVVWSFPSSTPEP